MAPMWFKCLTMLSKLLTNTSKIRYVAFDYCRATSMSTMTSLTRCVQGGDFMTDVMNLLGESGKEDDEGKSEGGASKSSEEKTSGK